MRDAVLLIARLMLCLLFLIFGYGKIAGFAGFEAYMAAKGMPFPAAFPILAIIIELGGGIVLGLGFETTIIAVLFAIYTLVTALIGHPFWTMTDPAQRYENSINFYKNIAIIGGFLLLATTGGGRFSIDGMRRGRRL